MLCMCFVAVSAKFRCAPLRKILKVQIIQFSSFFLLVFKLKKNIFFEILCYNVCLVNLAISKLVAIG